MLLLVGFSLINYVIILFLLMLICIYIAWCIFEKNYMIRISIVLGTLFNKLECTPSSGHMQGEDGEAIQNVVPVSGKLLKENDGDNPTKVQNRQ